MLIIPAIDLKDGAVVRLYKGRAEEKKVYSDKPADIARQWQAQGAKLIHVVDLDGAFSGVLKNLGGLREIINAIGVPVEFGGGVRSQETIKELLKLGVSRIVLGTKAIEDQNFLKKVFHEFGDKIIVSIDTRDRHTISTKGWQNESGAIGVADFAKQLKSIGFKRLIYTDISKDGTLTGPDIKGLECLLNEAKLNIIASGGISSLEDIEALKRLEKMGLEGIIVGKALYEGRIDLAQAIKLC